MNFGLLCDDPAAASLLSALRRHPVHRLTRAVLVSPRTDELLHGIAGVQFAEQWEDLLTAADIDAVIVGGTASAIWDGAKKLASETIPLLVFPTVAEGAAILYELSLIRDDCRGVLFPAWLHRFDPAVIRWKEQFAAVGSASYVQWEREVALGPGREVPRQTIDELLLRDADLGRLLFGGADHVTALRTGGTSTGSVIQSVVLTGRDGPELNWMIKSGPAEICRLTNATGAVLDLCLPVEDKSAERLLDEFVSAVEGQPAAIHWTDVLQAAEVVDAAHRSLERRRTIDLHHETLSERAIFKTQMAAMGCGVLMLTLLLMLGYLAVASIVPLDGRILKLLRLAVFAPLFAFLLMQLLLPLTRTSGTPSK
jgi:hypothetical protein